ncbi:MAG: leucine-rich repeat domain-containing protein [Promethearchaeota archaeon]
MAIQMYRRHKRDYYKILGVNNDSGQDKIRWAYINQARKFHPDRNKDPNAEQMFKIVEEANSILSNPLERKKYNLFMSPFLKKINNYNTGNDGIKYQGRRDSDVTDKSNIRRNIRSNIKNNIRNTNISKCSLEKQRQNNKHLYQELLNDVEEAIFNRKWEKAEQQLNLAKIFAQVFNLDINLVTEKIEKLQYQSKKIPYKGLISVYRPDYDVLISMEKLNPHIKAGPLFAIHKGNLNKLILIGRNIKALPESIGNLIDLQEFYIINDNILSTLPDSLCSLLNLKVLNINGNNLKSLPESVGNLKNLEQLYLEINSLRRLPDSIGDLLNLNWLYLKGNNLKYLPESLENLINLERLFLSGYQLNKVPQSIENLQKLKILNIEHIDSSELNFSFNNLKNLRVLNLIGNRFRSLPDSIGTMQNLHVLNLERNKLKTLPDSIKGLINLRIINLLGNEFTKLPEFLGDLEFLEYLYIEDEHIPYLPKSIKNLKNLKIICRSHEKRPTLPRNLKKIKNKIKIKRNIRRNEMNKIINADLIKNHFEQKLSRRLKSIESENLYLWMEKKARIQKLERESYRYSLIQAVQANRISYQPSNEITYQYVSLH